MLTRADVRFVAQHLRLRTGFRIGAAVHRDPLCLIEGERGRQDPYPYYELLRARGPLSRSTAGFWVTTDHGLARQILRDRRYGAPQVDDRPAPTPPFSFLEMDPPDHTRLRHFAATGFSPGAIATLRPVVATLATSLVEQIPDGRPFDLMATLAAPLPIAVITALLGIPDADAPTFRRYGTIFGSALPGIRNLRHAWQLTRAREELQHLFCTLLELRRRQPADDLISRIALDGGRTVRPEEFVPFCTLLLIGGVETTVNLLGNTVLALLRHPDAWERAVADPERAADAVDETLRYDSPVQRTGRLVLSETTEAGEHLKPGDRVVIMIGGANRDPAVFARPARFDLDRPGRDHLGFSAGAHYCVGAPLARLEATVALQTLVRRFPRLSRTSAPLVRKPGSLIRGMQRFEVTPV